MLGPCRVVLNEWCGAVESARAAPAVESSANEGLQSQGGIDSCAWAGHDAAPAADPAAASVSGPGK